MALLKREIDKAWKMVRRAPSFCIAMRGDLVTHFFIRRIQVDAATERETRARETIQQLKTEIQNLGKLVNEVSAYFCHSARSTAK